MLIFGHIMGHPRKHIPGNSLAEARREADKMLRGVTAGKVSVYEGEYPMTLVGQVFKDNNGIRWVPVE